MIDIVALAARSPLGMGEAAWSLGAIGAPAATCVREDAVLRASGMRKPHCARAPIDGGEDPATTLLLATYDELSHHVPSGARLGLAIGTSSGGMATAERWFASRDPALADGATYHAPFRALVQRVGSSLVRTAHPVTACSASTLSILLAMRWLEAGEVDYAIAGGYDALTVFVAAGFEALGATTASPPPRPFRKARDGMALGEGCGLFLLARPGSRTPIARILGAGASGDAVHLTAPDRTGGGLARAAQRALQGVDPETIDLVSVHGTSTPFNDPMEAKAIATALGRSDVAVHAGKASIGHTLGAAGVLESALAIDALRRQILPATAGEGELDLEVGCVPREVNEAGKVRAVLKLSSAFGGANAALVIARDGHVVASEQTAASASERLSVTVEETDDLDRISAVSGVARERLARMDGVCRLALFAVGTLAEKRSLKGAGIVLGTVLATIDVNAVYDENLRKKGAAHAEGRRFAYTTPNAAAGECAMAFGLTGPNLAVSRGVDAYAEANEIARDLIVGGDAERVVVVEVDSGGPAARAIADATGWPVRFGATARLLEKA
jgi:3-oxoacyl-[acyl-carrier-protein] synthase II